MLGFIGSTGPEGLGLGLRVALAGEKALIGSRDEARAKQAGEEYLHCIAAPFCLFSSAGISHIR